MDNADRQIAAHAEAEREDLERLRSLSMKERGELISLACEAAVEILRSRRAAGLPDIQPDPWPQSTWDFFRNACLRHSIPSPSEPPCPES